MILLWLAACDHECPEWRVDADGDGFGASGVVVHSCQPVEGRVTTKGDCDDADPAIHPGAAEVCNGIDDDCDPATDEDELAGVRVWRDRDGDGYGGLDPYAVRCPRGDDATVGGDCDDDLAATHPGAAEITCNDIDDDCDPETPDGRVYYRDADRDGFGDPNDSVVACQHPGPGWISDGTDCDDGDPSIRGFAEYWEDADGDGYGGGSSQVGCPPPDTVERGGDCDDEDPLVNPWRCEQCNGVDDDCNGLVDDGVTTTYWPDADGDGYGDDGAPTEACARPVGMIEVDGDCDDADASIHRGAAEVCDGVDQDCDAQVDEWLLVDFFADDDGDGHAAVGAPLLATACTRPPGGVTRRDDCDDADPERTAGAPERCDAIDHDCDGDPRLGAVDRWYVDRDGDGFGDSTTVVSSCSGGGLVARGGDADDLDPNVFPGAAEVCGGPLSDGDPRTDPCAPATCVWIVEGGQTAFYDVDTAQQLGTLPCELWTVGADGTAVTRLGTSLMAVDPTSGSCFGIAQVLAPSLPAPRTYCYDGYPYEPCGYFDRYPYWDDRGCYYPGYEEECCWTHFSELTTARLDANGGVWLGWRASWDAGGRHYHPSGALAGSWSGYVHALAFSPPDRVWTANGSRWSALDETLAGVGARVTAGSLEDALDGRMVAAAADWDHTAAFVDGRDGTVLAPFDPLDARDVLAVGLDDYLAVLPDGSVVRTDGDGSVAPFLPASPTGRDLLELSPCP
ncbi:MAG: putative metal-binding motif-containing protein [Alphaproteobacteria bacterium]|nr:putative metal-binding motif-containing protein [Alphaproteobacteria bacterium]